MESNRSLEDFDNTFKAHIVTCSHGILDWFSVTKPELTEPAVEENGQLQEASWMKRVKKSKTWTWFHLDTVNLQWVQDLINSLEYKGVIKGTFEDQAEGRGRKRAFNLVSFIQNTFRGTEGIIVPKASPDLEIFSLAIPYLDSENIAFVRVQDGILKQSSDDSSLLISRPLDQCFYTTSNDTSDLNSDQVVYRYYERKKKSRSPRVTRSWDSWKWNWQNWGQLNHRILMVSQLRLWKFGDIIITAFPRHLDSVGSSYNMLVDKIYDSLASSAPGDAKKLAVLLTRLLVETIQAPYNAGLHENLVTIFEEETAEQAKQQLKLYQQFKRLIEEKNANAEPDMTPAIRGYRYRVKEMREKMRRQRFDGLIRSEADDPTKDAMFIITTEMECFRIVMDICDELEMIASIVADQEVVIEDLSLQLKSSPDIEPITHSIKKWTKRLSGLKRRAEMVEKALNHLLDLKLKHSSLSEAEDTRILAKEADKRARESEKQSALLFVFTVITVFFTPLAFAASFLAIPSQDFPGDNWNKTQIGLGLARNLGASHPHSDTFVEVEYPN